MSKAEKGSLNRGARMSKMPSWKYSVFWKNWGIALGGYSIECDYNLYTEILSKVKQHTTNSGGRMTA